MNTPPQPRFRAPVVLAVGCLDAVGHGGLVVDIKTCAALGVHAATCAVAVSTSSTTERGHALPLPPSAVIAQLGAAFGDLAIDAIKLGDLASADGVGAVAEGLQQARNEGHKLEKIVVDPSLVDKTGAQRLDDTVATAMVRHLLPRSFVLSANIYEAALLTRRPVGDRASIRDAAKALFDRGVAWPAIHSPSDERFAVTFVFDGQGFVELGDDRIRTPHLRGSGDTFAAAVAAGLARGRGPIEAIDEARGCVRAAIGQTLRVGHGPHPINPLVDLYAAVGLDPNPIAVDDEHTHQGPPARA